MSLGLLEFFWPGAGSPIADGTLVRAPFTVPNPPDETYWLAKPVASALLLGLLTAGGQPPTPRWHYDYDTGSDAAIWQGKPVASALLRPLLTAGGKPPQPQPSVGLDDPPAWAWAPQYNIGLYTPAAPQRSFRWNFNFDDAPAPVWAWQNQNSLLRPQAQPPTPRWRYEHDSVGTLWTWAAPHASALTLPAPPPPPGAGKRRDFPSYIPQPPRDAKPNKPFQPVWDKRRQEEEEAARVLAELPPAPVPLPPAALFERQTDAQALGLPELDHGIHPEQLEPGLRDAQDLSDLAGALQAFAQRAAPAPDTMSQPAASHDAEERNIAPSRPRIVVPPAHDLGQRMRDARDLSDAMALMKAIGLIGD